MTSLKSGFLKKSFKLDFPFILSNKSCTLKVLLFPGLPQIIKGTLFIKQNNSQKIFSLKALFLAIPLWGFISIWSNIYLVSFSGIFRKPYWKFLSNFLLKAFLSSFVGNLR